MNLPVFGALDPRIAGIVALAGILRGFSGFGFSLAAVPALSLILPLNTVVPLALGLEAVGVVPAIGRIWKHAAYPVLWRLLAGALGAMPIGLVILHLGTPALLKPAMSCLVLVGVALIWHPRELRPAAPPGDRGAWIAGAVSGLLNGAAAMSGPPIILYMFSAPFPPERARATMMLFFSASAVATFALGLASGVYTPPSAGLFLWCAPFLALGIEIGALLRKPFSPQAVRRGALLALAAGAFTSLLATFHLT